MSESDSPEQVPPVARVENLAQKSHYAKDEILAARLSETSVEVIIAAAQRSGAAS